MGYVGQAPLATAPAVVSSAMVIDGTISNADLAAAAAVAISKTALDAGTGITLDTNTLNVDASQPQVTTVGTIGTGTWEATDVGVEHGGTGASTLTDHGVVLGSGTAAVSVTDAGTAGQVLTSGGAGADPTWAATGDITSIVAGAGMTGSSLTTGDATLNVIAGTGITVNADDVAVTAEQTGITSIYNTGLHVGRDADNTIDFTTDDQIRFQIANVDNEIAFLAGGVGHFDGDVYAYSTTTTSDRRLKKNIVNLSDAISKIKQLNGVSYDWKDEKRGSSAGLIAQEVQAILPQLVSEAPNMGDKSGSHLTLNYDGVIGLLVEAVKELAEITVKRNGDTG